MLVAVLAVLLALGQAIFVWNHFYANGAYLYDSGYFSSIGYRAGVVPHNPRAAQFNEYYFTIHMRPVLCLLSLLSEVVPLARIPWFALTLGLLYATVVLAPGLLVRDRLARVQDRGGLMTEFALGLFIVLGTALSAPVIICWNFPHYEIAVAAGINLAVYWWSVGRYRLALASCAALASIREDAGLIAASFFAALAAWWLVEGRFQDTGETASAGRGRWCIRLCLACLGFSLLLFVVQKLFFGNNSLLREEYLGYGRLPHLDHEQLKHRAHRFITNCHFLWIPIVLAMLLSLVRSSFLPLTGWIACFPYLAINFLAVQERRGEFMLYFSFPFVSALFIPLILDQMATRRIAPGTHIDHGRWALIGLTLCGCSSTVGLLIDYPALVRSFVVNSTSAAAVHPATMTAAITGFIDKYRQTSPGYRIDLAMASLAIDADPSMDQVVSTSFEVDQAQVPLLFSAVGHQAPMVKNELIAGDRLGIWKAEGTLARAWLPAGEQLPAPWRRVNLLDDEMLIGHGVSVEHPADHYVIDATAPYGLALSSPELSLRPGSYEITWNVSALHGPAEGEAAGAFDVLAGDRTLARTEVVAGTTAASLRFTVTDDAAITLRYWHNGGCGLTIAIAGWRVISQDPPTPVWSTSWSQGLKQSIAVPKPLVPGQTGAVVVILQRQPAGIGAWNLQEYEPITVTFLDHAGTALRTVIRYAALPLPFRDTTVNECSTPLSMPIPSGTEQVQFRFRQSTLFQAVTCSTINGLGPTTDDPPGNPEMPQQPPPHGTRTTIP